MQHRAVYRPQFRQKAQCVSGKQCCQAFLQWFQTAQQLCTWAPTLHMGPVTFKMLNPSPLAVTVSRFTRVSGAPDPTAVPNLAVLQSPVWLGSEDQCGDLHVVLVTGLPCCTGGHRYGPIQGAPMALPRRGQTATLPHGGIQGALPALFHTFMSSPWLLWCLSKQARLLHQQESSCELPYCRPSLPPPPSPSSLASQPLHPHGCIQTAELDIRYHQGTAAPAVSQGIILTKPCQLYKV